jgi:uncharacterized protein involved in exopolysaccharide biosynthesis
MTSRSLDTYVSRFERELATRGIRDVRIVEEVREHLIDAVEESLKRGLSVEVAEREAFTRFGAPETIAAHVDAEKRRLMPQCLFMLARVVHWARGVHMAGHWKVRFAEALGMVWHRKWWILVPTVISAAVTSVVSSYLVPTRYQSQASILVVPQGVAQEYVHSTVTGRLGDRLQQINTMILSRPRLERIITDFNLYERERRTAPLDDVIERMRQDIRIHILTSQDPQEDNRGAFTVSFFSSDPRAALQVTERLVNFFVEENFRDRRVRAEGTIAFIDTQITDVREQIIRYEKTLDTLRVQNRGRRLSQADLLPYEVLQETYKALLTKSQESRMAANLERRQIGEQFKILDPARLPKQPVGPSRLTMNVMGGLAGFGLALAFVGISSVGRPRPEDQKADATLP